MTARQKALRVGFLGAGFNANFHCAALQSVRGADVVGVYAPKGADALAKKVLELGIGEASVYNTPADLIKNVDVVAVCAPNFVRLRLMREIAQHGKDLAGVVCEKPLGRNCAEAAELVQLMVNKQTAYFENQNHMPAVLRCRAQLAQVEKTMGPAHLVRTYEEHGGPHEAWFWDPTQQGGGVWCDMGCHSAAIGWLLATPQGEAPTFMEPYSVQATLSLSKWGRPEWAAKLLKDRGVDYTKTPAEDYADVALVFRNPKTGQLVTVKAIDSWCFEGIGLKLEMEGMGPGYGLRVNTLNSPAGILISDAAAEAIANAENALEKSNSSRGQLVVMEDEPKTYGYTDEWRDAIAAFNAGRDGKFNFAYGARVTELVMAGYMAHELGRTLKFDDTTRAALRTYVPKIQQGLGREVLCA